MSFIFYLAGLILGVAFFIWALSTYHQGVDRLAEIRDTKNKEKTPRIDQEPREQKITFDRERTCPLCRATLTRREALYATTLESEKGKKILIYGCRYCYKSDENRDEQDTLASPTIM